jgi:cardiolipin synthase
MGDVLTVPNIITFIRIIIVPAFAAALIYDRYDYALILFITAGFSDALDGFIARATKQKTRFGTFLDPLADKCLLITSFILFAVYGLIPKWLAITVISRDVIVTLGWFLMYILSHMTKPEPSLMGKATIVMQVLLIAYTLLSINVNYIPPPTDLMFWTVAVLTIVSGLQYIYRGLQITNEK